MNPGFAGEVVCAWPKTENSCFQQTNFCLSALTTASKNISAWEMEHSETVARDIQAVFFRAAIYISARDFVSML